MILLVCIFENLDRMEYLVRQQLVELQPTAQTISDEFLRLEIVDFVHQSVSQMNGRIMKFPFEAHNSPHTATVQTAVHGLQVNSRQQIQQRLIRSADILFSKVTRGIVDHTAGYLIKVCMKFP